jgi:hypothetical protein
MAALLVILDVYITNGASGGFFLKPDVAVKCGLTVLFAHPNAR